MSAENKFCPQCGFSLGSNKAAEEMAPARALTEDREQQFRPGLGEGYEAQFIDDQQFQASQPLLQLHSVSS